MKDISQDFLSFFSMWMAGWLFRHHLWKTLSFVPLYYFTPYLQILKDDAVKVMHSLGQQIWKTQHWPLDWWSIFLPIPKKGNAKECSNYCTLALISHASKFMLKILQARPQQHINREFQMYKLDLKEGEARDQIANILWIIERARESQKNVYFCFTDCAKDLTV